MSGEKTEQPTPKKLRDAREKGQTAKSQEVPSALVVLAMVAYLAIRGPHIFQILAQTTNLAFQAAPRPWEEALPLLVPAVGLGALSIILPLVALVMIASLCANLAQVGFLFAFQAAIPKLENLHPKKWFEKVFSKKGIFEFLKNVAKVVVLSLVVWRVLSNHWSELFLLPGGNPRLIWMVMGNALWDLTISATVAFTLLAAADYFWQRHCFTRDNMMSKDDVKREYKEMEGDPLIKSKRKQLHQEMASQNAVGKVRQAKVLVTNPEHVAVALDYEEGRTPLPVVLAKGEGHLARRMIEEARRLGVPVLRQVDLARALFRDGTEDAYIPRNLLGPVAEVLHWLKTLERKP